MTVPLMILAVGAIVAGFVGIPQVLGRNNAIETFLEPSFVASAAIAGHAATAVQGAEPAAAAETAEHAARVHLSTGGELGLMLLSVALAAFGIWLAVRMFVRRPQIAESLAQRWSGVHRVLSNKYYVDELYGATVVRGTLTSARGLWGFDRVVVDGAVNGSGLLTQFSAWVSHMIDKYLVDGLVNLVGWVAGEGSYLLRRVQTGLIQNYALVMLLGVFAFLTLYFFTR
jgi:NADH-quinone oxidoreductase subunit L